MSTDLSAAQPRNRCRNCGSRVSYDFRRVFGDDDNIAHACRTCTAVNVIREGAASVPHPS